MRATRVLALLLFVSACGQQQRFRHESAILEASAARLDFGATTLGMPVDRSLTWSDRGRLTAQIASVKFDPDDGAFSVARMPTVVDVHGEVNSTVTFLPRTAGVHRAVLEVFLVDGDPIRVVLEGKGVDARGVPSGDLKFGRPAVGGTRTRTLSFRNDFETPVPVKLAFRGADAAEFHGPDTLWIPPFAEVNAVFLYSPVGHPGPRTASLEYGACPLCALAQVNVEANAVPVPIAMDPDHVDFGAVAVDTDRRIQVSMTNLTDEIITVHSVALSPDTEPGFALDTLMMPLRLLPEVPEKMQVSYSPPHLNSSVGAVIVTSDAEPTPNVTVPLRANGGGSQLLVEPRSVNFKSVPVGGRGLATITVSNGGANPQSAPLTITRVDISGAPFSLIQTIPQGTTLASGDSMPLQVSFDPAAEGAFQGTVTVYSDDPISPSVTAVLSGTGRIAADCVLAVSPPAIDFGGVLPSAAGELGVRIVNAGTDVCTVSSATVTGDSVFSLTKPRAQVTLNPGDGFVTLVLYRPTAVGSYSGTLSFDTSRQTAPKLDIPLSAGADSSCLRPEPISLDFGRQRQDCGVRELTGTWRNTCTRSITASNIAFGQGTDTQTFELVNTSTLPANIPPNGKVTATVRMRPTTTGYQVWPLFVTANDSTLPTLMEVQGDGLPSALHSQEFLQTQPAKLDLLWVVDNTASMDVNRNSLEANVGAFLNTLDSRGVDYQIAVTTTGIDPPPASQTRTCPGGANGAEAGRFFPVDNSRPRIISPVMANRADLLRQNVQVGGCNTVQQGLRATWLSMVAPNIDNADNPYTPQPNDGNLGFLRDDAALAVVVVSNQEDQSPNSVATNISALRGLKPKTPMTFSAIVGPPSGCPNAVQPGLRYLEVVKAFGGVSASVCATDWGQNLNTIADGLFRSRDTFPLDAPAEPTTVRVTLNGQAATGWHYDAARQSVVFDTPPSPGTNIQIDYSEPCPAP